MRILRLSPNLNGRTFVTGDIHGSYSCVVRFLEEIGFNFENDRLICAGDLVDRGPDNEACLKLLFEPWFFCTKGNHEQLMEDWFTDGAYGDWWIPNGGKWGLRYKNDTDQAAVDVRAAVKKIKDLPYLITVEMRNGEIFHVLHAELPPRTQHPITDADLADPVKFKELATQQTMDGDTIIWGRYLFMPLYHATLDDHTIRKFKRGAELNKTAAIFNPGLSHIYSGHTIVKAPVQFTGQTNLDTMAYGSYEVAGKYGTKEAPEWCGLTVTEPETGKFWLVNDREFKEVKPVVIDDIVNEPRGLADQPINDDGTFINI